MEGIFQLKTAADLREKLRRDLMKLKALPESSDLAFNFFVTAEHMLDWVYPGLRNKERDRTREATILLQVCSHLANGAKHFQVEAKRHKSVGSTHRATGISILRLTAVAPPFGANPRLVVRLRDDAAKELGDSIEAITLAEKVMSYWDEHPLT